MRFSVKLYGDHAFHAATFDELYSKIAAYHRARQRGCQFRIEFKLNDGYGSYEITDNHEEA